MSKPMKTSIKFFFLTAVVSLLWACGNDTAQTTPANSPTATNSAQTTSTNSPNSTNSASTKIQVTATEMKFQLSQSTVPAGTVEFETTNKGKIPHEMVVIKTDLPLDKLPLEGDKLDEDKAGKEIGEIEEDDLKSGVTKTLKVNLTPGKYLIVCNLPGHFKAGMRTFLTVQ
ncbi:hypothetical protein NIES4075_30660 [Tolypothrix sp. NIES-4075]|uniref:plastocyanin/azurin family copper-binding protein n=1 Tax=Tolypothrix sp. NIES-4075 TaxID=2005459 RepID=UPI000B6AB55B|nr:plastocyanin/azurin family copper-binding protein [Tolypothrix sp. NIES-4075]GAX42066.1 hypothetical protein NIES4075_30660 [Tolypothrix sp. NIES-4075]